MIDHVCHRPVSVEPWRNSAVGVLPSAPWKYTYRCRPPRDGSETFKAEKSSLVHDWVKWLLTVWPTNRNEYCRPVVIVSINHSSRWHLEGFLWSLKLYPPRNIVRLRIHARCYISGRCVCSDLGKITLHEESILWPSLVRRLVSPGQ